MPLVPEAYFTGEFNRDVYICEKHGKEISGFELFKNAEISVSDD